MDTSLIAAGAISLSRDLRSALRKARDLGIKGVEIDARSGLDPEQISQTGIRQIRKWLGDEGLSVSAVAFRTRGSYSDPDRLEGRIAATKAAMKLAHDLGASTVLNHIGDIPPESSGRQWQLLMDVLSDLGAWGQRVGGRLCAEVGRAAPADILRVIESLPEGSLACDIVTGAMVVYDHSPIEAVAMLARHIGYVHVTDAVTGAFRGRGRAVILGTGQVDLVGVLASLEEHGYHEWIGLEPVDDHGAREELAAAISFLHAL